MTSYERGRSGPRRRLRLSNEERRAQIVRHGAEVFDRLGYANTTMDEIARSVGVAKPTLYHYFASKDELLATVSMESIELLLSRHERRLKTALGASQLLPEMMVDILEMMETHRGYLRVFYENLRELPPQVRPVVLEKRERYEGMVIDQFRAGIAEGTFRGVDPELASHALLGICNWAHQRSAQDSQAGAREVALLYWNLLFDGLHPQTSAR